MKSTKKRECLDKDCCKSPCFNSPGQTPGVYCKNHKLPGMIDVCHKQCQDENCTKRPFYNFKSEIIFLHSGYFLKIRKFCN